MPARPRSTPLHAVPARSASGSLARVLALALALLTTLTQARASAPQPATPIRVVATTGMIADTVSRVAGELATVAALMKPGVDPHLFKPTRTDITQIMSADLVFYNGLLLEGKMIDALVRAASAGKTVIAVTQEIDESSLLTPDPELGHHDPHVWMDPAAWALTVPVIERELIASLPAHKQEISANAAALAQEIAQLDAYAKSVLETVPPERRVLVTAHDAFNYFGRRYGFEVVGIQGLSTESEAGVRDIENLVNLLVERKIPAVFVESTVSDRNIKALIAGAAARGHTVTIGGELFSDALGPAGAYEGTYLGMIDHNVTTIARALGGVAPERGMVGKLGTRDGPR